VARTKASILPVWSARRGGANGAAGHAARRQPGPACPAAAGGQGRERAPRGSLLPVATAGDSRPVAAANPAAGGRRRQGTAVGGQRDPPPPVGGAAGTAVGGRRDPRRRWAAPQGQPSVAARPRRRWAAPLGTAVGGQRDPRRQWAATAGTAVGWQHDPAASRRALQARRHRRRPVAGATIVPLYTSPGDPSWNARHRREEGAPDGGRGSQS